MVFCVWANFPALTVIDILPTLALCATYPALEKNLLRIWGLVLESQGVSYHLDVAQPRLLVSPALAPKAVKEILDYEAENHVLPRPVPLPDNSWSFLLLLAVFVALNIWIDHWNVETQKVLYQAGRIEAGLVVQGQWWRCVTALFLHADAGHLLSNVVALGILGPLLGRRLGFGLTWAFFLVSGALGNLVNSWVQDPNHWSIGASTGVFGLVGVLSGSASRFSPGHRVSAVLLPLGFAFSFLAMLGAGQERVDLGAHFFGLLCGLSLRLMLRRDWLLKFASGPGYSFSAGVFCLAISLWAWFVALTA